MCAGCSFGRQDVGLPGTLSVLPSPGLLHHPYLACLGYPRCLTWRLLAAGINNLDRDIEPLTYWIPGMLPPQQQPLQPEQRQTVCEDLMLQQHSAWEQLASQS